LPEVITEPLPASIAVVQGNQLYIPKEELPPKLINRLIRIAAFQNPEFYKAQAMRFSTFNKPRIIACAETFPQHIGLPRGCLDEVLELLSSLNITVDLIDERNAGEPISTTFLGILNKEQKPIAETLLKYDAGILSATTGFGKTVLAAHIIAARKRNTLILVHRKQLMDQWLAQLQTFLNTENLPIGQIGGGKRKPSGQMDVALIQSLVQKGMVDDCVADYGQLIVDECHHLSAVSFEVVARQCKAKYVLGLTATPKRKDGQHPIIFMQCGPIRYHVDAKLQAEKRPFDHHVIPRYTKFCLPATIAEQYERPPIQTVYAELSLDATRNQMIIDDVRHVLEMKRSPIILTERKEHVAFFAKHLKGVANNIIVLQGGMGTKERKTVLERLGNIRDDEERILIATGRYIGEGFDDARLDTLFLAMPVSWKGTLAQYAGRLHRTHHNKTEVRIYDYVDHLVPMLERMNQKRLIGYKSLGYTIASADQFEKV
jgi:superfamily II DNA or RNA helicase